MHEDQTNEDKSKGKQKSESRDDEPHPSFDASEEYKKRLRLDGTVLLEVASNNEVTKGMEDPIESLQIGLVVAKR